jgi:predicted TIM-barrel enzyme
VVLSTTESLGRVLNYLARNLFYVLGVNTLAQDKVFSLDLFGNIPDYFVDANTIFRIAHTSFSVYNSDVIKFIRKGF